MSEQVFNISVVGRSTGGADCFTLIMIILFLCWSWWGSAVWDTCTYIQSCGALKELHEQMDGSNPFLSSSTLFVLFGSLFGFRVFICVSQQVVFVDGNGLFHYRGESSRSVVPLMFLSFIAKFHIVLIVTYILAVSEE